MDALRPHGSMCRSRIPEWGFGVTHSTLCRWNSYRQQRQGDSRRPRTMVPKTTGIIIQFVEKSLEAFPLPRVWHGRITHASCFLYRCFRATRAHRPSGTTSPFVRRSRMRRRTPTRPADGVLAELIAPDKRLMEACDTGRKERTRRHQPEPSVPVRGVCGAMQHAFSRQRLAVEVGGSPMYIHMNTGISDRAQVSSP
jgi:hypothetical protein